MIDQMNGTVSGVEPARPAIRTEAGRQPEQKTTPVAEKVREDEAAAEKEPVVDREAAAETLAKAMFTEFPPNSTLEIDVNDQDNGFIYKAVDRETGEVIKQFPAAEVLERLERMSKFQGLAVDGLV
jgi:flagellar protein FlaG